MDSHHFTPVLCVGLTETLQLKVEREETAQQFPRLDPTTLKEEDSEKPVTQAAHAEPARDGAAGGLPLFEQIKEESCFFCTVETVKQEAAMPEQAFDHKPLKSECLGIAASVKLEIAQNKGGLSEDGRTDGKQASTQNHQRRPGEMTPETPDPTFARPPPQNPKGRQLSWSRNQTENKSCSAPHNGGRKPELRSSSCSREVASGRPRSDETAHSSSSDSTSRRFERKRRCVSRSASPPSSSSPPGFESGSEEQKRDPTWAPHASHQAPRRSGAERGLRLRDMGATSRKTAENKGRPKLDKGRSGFPGPEPGARPGGGGSRRYVCSLCHKAFLTKRDLARHGRVHSGEKPFACARCGRRFNDVGNMRKHALVHSGERPHVCAECGKRFTESGNLRRHQRVHEPAGTGSPRRFGCEACGRSYKEKGGLTRHQKARAWEGKGACVMRR